MFLQILFYTIVVGPDGNVDNSFLTFRSRSSLLFGVVLFFSQTTFNFCDQASWQSRIAAKPEQGAIGFIIAAFLWFGIPTTITLTSSFTYLSMSYQNGSELINVNDIEKGMWFFGIKIMPYLIPNKLFESQNKMAYFCCYG